MLKVEDHIQLGAFVVGVPFRLIHSYPGRLTDSHDVVAGEYTAVHFLKEFMYAGTVADIGVGVAVHAVEDFSVRIRLDLADHGDDIHAETVNSLVAPPGHHIVYFVAHFGILPVEIRLFFREQMQIVLSRRFIEFPCGSAEIRSPVGGLMSVFGIFPDIIVTVWVVFGLAALDEPFMLVRTVVHDQVHDDFDPSFMGGGEHAVEVFHGSELRHNISVVRDVVTVVIIGRFVYRRQPDHINAEFFEIIQMHGDTVQVADSIPVTVLKGAWIDLINDSFFPPGALFIIH